jgi:hypothetical protein
MASNNSHTFVTSFYDLNKLEMRRDGKKTDFYLSHGPKLLQCLQNFVVFVDKDSRECLEEIVGIKDNIKYIDIDFYDLPVTKILPKNKVINLCQYPDLKDTYYYHCLMISKTYFMMEAVKLNHFKSDQFSWIDFGFLQLVNTKEDIDEFPYLLEKVSNHKTTKIRIPGNMFNGHIRDQLTSYSHPCWTFCGSFFSGNIESIEKFDTQVNNALQELKKNGLITWEINVWAHIYIFHGEIFDRYFSHHCLNMLRNYVNGTGNS